MKIYRKAYKYGDSYYFMTSRENGLFSFSLALPDRETLKLNSCFIGKDEENKVYDNAVTVSDDTYRHFNSIYDKEGNYNDVCSLLMAVFKDVDQESLNKAFRRNDNIFDLTDRCIREYRRQISDWYYRDISQEVEHCMKLWDNDSERVVKWIVSEEIPELTSFNNALIDIFGEHHPTEYKLLHKFYSHWGKDLDSIIKKCIEKYPDEKDFDLATYMCRRLLNEQREREIEEIKERKGWKR